MTNVLFCKQVTQTIDAALYWGKIEQNELI